MNKKDFLQLPIKKLVELVDHSNLSLNTPITNLIEQIRVTKGTMKNLSDLPYGGNINKAIFEKDTAAQEAIRDWLKQVSKDDLPFGGNTQSAMKAGDRIAMSLINEWNKMQKQKPATPEKSPAKFGKECVNPNDYSTQNEWDAEPIKITFIEHDKKSVTQCYEKGTLEKSFVEEPQTLVGRWLPNRKTGQIDNNGAGGAASAKQWYYKLLPNNYVVWNTKLKSWINNYTEFKAYRIANEVRIGNLASLSGISLAHGAQKVPIYYVIPDDDYWSDKLADYVKNEHEQRTGEKLSQEIESIPEIMKMLIDLNEKYPGYIDEYDAASGKLLAEYAVREKIKMSFQENLFLGMIYKVRKDYYQYYTELTIEAITTELEKLGITVPKIKPEENEVQNIIEKCIVLKDILKKVELQSVDYRGNIVDRINDVDHVFSKFEELLGALDWLKPFVKIIEKERIEKLESLIDIFIVLNRVPFLLLKLKELYNKISFNEKSLQNQVVETLGELVQQADRLSKYYIIKGVKVRGDTFKDISRKHLLLYYKELITLGKEELPIELKYFTDLEKKIKTLSYQDTLSKLQKENKKGRLNFSKKLEELSEGDLRKEAQDIIVNSSLEIVTKFLDNGQTAFFLYNRENKTAEGQQLLETTRDFVTDVLLEGELPTGLSKAITSFMNLPRPSLPAPESPPQNRRPPAPAPVRRHRRRRESPQQ